MDEQPLMCPRCGSTNTKFCYYNNYARSQPRHFCRGCKKHWTKGGTLRNVTKRMKKVSKTSPKRKNKKVDLTCKSVVGCSDVDEGLGQKMDENQLVVCEKDESFGGVSTEFDQSHELWCSDVVGLGDDNVLLDLEMFGFELPGVSEPMRKTDNDETEDQLPSFSENAAIDIKWEDLLEITQPWI